MVETSAIQALRARGPLAIFTRPEFKTERVSYAVMTPSAARGLLEAVLWKPAICWQVLRIKVLAPIAFQNCRRNELNSRAATPPAEVIHTGGTLRAFFADDDRCQRNTVALRDVDYVVEARFILTERAGPGDNLAKFVDMFRRRVEKGQHFHQPYFGCRECVADVTPATGNEVPVPDSRDLGIMLWDIDHAPSGTCTPRFFAARLNRGVLDIPADPEATLPHGERRRRDSPGAV